MSEVALHKSGVAFIPVNITAQDGINMARHLYVVDTGATRTTIPKNTLTEELGFSDEWVKKNKVIIPDNEKPTMADGKKADVYKIPITRINIGGYEIQHDDYILTSDTIKLSFLLGLDIMSYFNFSFNFDATEDGAKYGRMYYEFRESRRKEYTKMGEPFAYRLDDSQEK